MYQKYVEAIKANKDDMRYINCQEGKRHFPCYLDGRSRAEIEKIKIE